MQFFSHILLALLTGYLSLTNQLAEGLRTILPGIDSPHLVVQHEPELTPTPSDTAQETLDTLYSDYEWGGPIPDILITNSEYQQATVIGSGPVSASTSPGITDALVNIFCTFKTPTYTKTNSGTGFFINNDGVIMTNAHVAQFLLLETIESTGETECIIRTGDPAVAQYEAELLYISPAWIQKHATLITDPEPRGTGERDFALLYVTSGLEDTPLPAHFPYFVVHTELLNKNLIGRPIVAAGYPAEHLLTEDVALELRPVVATTTLTDMFTFGSQYADVFSIADSAVGEFGASGGPVFNTAGEVIGLITTKGSEDEGLRSLRAISLSYIDRTMIEESTFDLHNTASGQLAFRAQLFMDTIVPFLSRVLELELTRSES